MHFCAGLPIILVGCKKDLRRDPRVIEDLRKTSQRPVTPEEVSSLPLSSSAPLLSLGPPFTIHFLPFTLSFTSCFPPFTPHPSPSSYLHPDTSLCHDFFPPASPSPMAFPLRYLPPPRRTFARPTLFTTISFTHPPIVLTFLSLLFCNTFTHSTVSPPLTLHSLSH